MEGTQIGPYVIMGKLAAGGMATVYVARHTRLENVVGIKILHAHYQQDENLRTRFVDEAKIQANLRHPNILAVQDILELPDASGMVMELLTGCALDTYFRHAGLPIALPRAIELFLALTDALVHAHSQGVVHRDMKPSNVFLHCLEQQVVPKVMDFGIAKLQTHALESQVTAAGAMLGTPQYMAPEQFEDSSKVDHRADMFSLGVMFYETTVGVVPFIGKGIAEVMKGVLTQTPRSPSEIIPGYAPAVEAFVMRLLAKKRADRYESMPELHEALLELARECGREKIPGSEVPRMDLRDKGIDVTSHITSSKLSTTPEVATEKQGPEQKKESAGAEPAPQVPPPVAPETEDSWVRTSPPVEAKRRGSKLPLIAGIVMVVTILAVAAFFVFQPGKVGKKEKDEVAQVEKKSVPAPVPDDKGKDKAASGAGGQATDEPEETDGPSPLPDVPRLEGMQLGRWCGVAGGGLVNKVIEARLQGGWRGKRLSRLPADQLSQLGVGKADLENFKKVRAANDLVREVDRRAIQASVVPCKQKPLSAQDLERTLAMLTASEDLTRYVKAKSEFICQSLPLNVAGKDNEVGELYRKKVAEYDLGDGLFSQLEAGPGTDSHVAAEIDARATCCLLNSGLLPE